MTDRPCLFRLDTTGQIVRQLPPIFASDVEWADSRLWCANEEDAALTEIDPVSGDSLRAFMLPVRVTDGSTSASRQVLLLR
jgi:hypothetical protein